MRLAWTSHLLSWHPCTLGSGVQASHCNKLSQEFGNSPVTVSAQERKLQQQRDVQAALQQQIAEKQRIAVSQGACDRFQAVLVDWGSALGALQACLMHGMVSFRSGARTFTDIQSQGVLVHAYRSAEQVLIALALLRVFLRLLLLFCACPTLVHCTGSREAEAPAAGCLAGLCGQVCSLCCQGTAC